MWMQVIKTRLKQGEDTDLVALMDRLKALEQPNSGFVRSIAARDQKDPSAVYIFVTFESEEKARAREHDERRQEGLQAVRQTMAEMFDGPPEFTDLNVVAEYAGT
jgi:quinol monooxygenase YgiN